MSERPTKLEVGQRWQFKGEVASGEPETVEKLESDGGWKCDAGIHWPPGRIIENPKWRFLGYAPGHSPQPSETGGAGRMGEDSCHPVACLSERPTKVGPGQRWLWESNWEFTVGPRHKNGLGWTCADRPGYWFYDRRFVDGELTFLGHSPQSSETVEAAKPTEEEGAAVWQATVFKTGDDGWVPLSPKLDPGADVHMFRYRLVTPSGRILRTIPEAPAPREAPVYVGIDWGKGVKAPKCNDRHRAYGLSCLEDRGHAGNHRSGEAEWDGVKLIKLFRAPLSGSPYCMAQGPLCTRPKAEGATMCEEHIAAEMRRRDEARKPELARRPFQQSHVLTAGGVWSMRDEGRHAKR